jgi:hypothetical protein
LNYQRVRSFQNINGDKDLDVFFEAELRSIE